MTTTKLSGTSLDRQFEELAHKHDISATRLKAVYFRGVEEFLDSDMTFGSATMYGLARVQRFINGNDTTDADLREQHIYSEVSAGIDLSDDNMFWLPDVLYASGASVAELFRPGQVTAITVSDDAFHVDGVLGDLRWSYALDTVSGDVNFSVL